MAKEPSPKVPKVNAPTSKVTIAFPFASIRMDDPSDELRELAAIVAELAEEVAKLRPSERTDELVSRVHGVITKLQS
jgi:hypothetical protein